MRVEAKNNRGNKIFCERQHLAVRVAALPVGTSHPFHQRMNQILDEKKFDEHVEGLCQRFYANDVAVRDCLRESIFGC